DVFIAGKGLTATTGNCAVGVDFGQDLSLKSGSGKIGIYGIANAAAASTYSNGVTFNGTTSRKTIVSSSNPAADAIVISGNAGSTASVRSSGVFFHGQTAGANVNNIIANTGTGGVQIIGRSVSTATTDLGDNVGDGIELTGTAVLAKSGPILLTGTTGTANSANNVGFSMDHSSAPGLANSNVAIGGRAATTIDSVDMAASSSNITINADSFIVGDAVNPKSISTTGAFVLQPADGAASFDKALSTGALAISSGATGATIGQSGTGGTVSGLTQNAQDVTISGAISIAGPISVYAANIAANNDLITSSGAVLLKATGNISLGAGTSASVRRTIQTSAAAITLWSNAAANSTGAIALGNYTKLTSSGGAITLAGGASATETSPTGRAKGNGTTTYISGVTLGTSAQSSNVDILSGGGNIAMRGYTGVNLVDGFGVKMWQGATVDSGVGAIIIDGATDNCTGTNNCHAFEIFGGNLAPTTIQSAKASGTAISITGVTTGTSSDSIAVSTWNGGATNFHKIQATGGGDISISGTSPTSTGYSVRFNSSYLYSKGAITINSGTQGLAFGNNGTAVTSVFGGSTAASDDAGDITLQSDNVNFAAGGASFRNTGKLVIEPVSASFSAAQTIPATYFAQTGQSGIRLGKSGNTSNLTIAAPLTSAGDVQAYGGAVADSSSGITTTASGNISITASGAYSGAATLSAAGNATIQAASFAGTGVITSAGTGGVSVTATAGDITTTAGMSANTSTTAPIKLSATGNVLLGSSLTTAGGPVTVGSDSDDVAQGGIRTAIGTTITSNGGNVVLGGGVDPAVGFAKATGQIYSTANAAYSGVRLMGAISSGTGNVSVRGQDSALVGISSHNTGIEAEKTASIKSTTGNILIEGKLSTGVTGAGNHLGVVLGWGGVESTGTNVYSTTTGSITIKGSASTLNSTVGYGVWLSPSTISSTSGPITIQGDGAATSAYDVFFYGADVSSTSGAVLVQTGTTGGNANFDIATSRLNSDASVTLEVETPTFTTLQLTGTGAKTIQSPTGASSFGGSVSTANITISSTSSALTIGSSTNSMPVTIGKAQSIAGPIAIYGSDVTVSTALTATTATGSISVSANGTFTNSAAISSAAGNQPTTIKAQKAALTGSIASGTATTQITGYAAARTINLGLTGDTTDTLAISNTELSTITAGTIRIGDSNSGNITISANITIASAKSNNLALRTSGNVTATNSAIITATNLGISAGGTISLGGLNGVSGNLAIVAGGASAGSGASFGSSGNYSVATVDGITPVFGVGKNISVTSAPAVGSTEVRYLNQTWSAPPVLSVKDEYGYVLSTKNLNASTYTTDVTDSGSPSLAGTTPVISGGTQTFSSLKFTTATGSTTLTFTTAGLAAGGTSSVTTGTYDVQAGEPATIAIATTSTSAPAGKTGFGLTATLKDAGGNTVAGPHATDAITVTVADGDVDATNNATIVSGSSPATVAGVADFSNLILGGKVGVTYTLTFSVTFTDSTSASQTVTATKDVTVTPGDATNLKVQTAAAGFVNRTNFSTQPAIAIKDAYGNTVTSSTASVAVAVTAVGSASTQGLTGTTTINAVSGVATFAGVGKTGLIGAKRLTFTSSGLSSDTQDFTLTFGAAYQLAMTTPTTAMNNTVFATQPIVTIQDQDANTVADSTATVTLTSSNATIGGTLVGGNVAMDAVAGVANFSGKNVKLTGSTGSKSLTATIAGGITLTNTVTLTYGAAYKVAIIRQAAGAVNGVAFATQPQAVIQDISGNTVDTTDSIDVTSSGASLGGTTSVAAVNGKVTFTNLKLTGTVGTYVLTFRSGALASDVQNISLTFGAAHHLSVTNAASGAVNGVAFTTQPVIA
ncbi:MAG: beta strand repeat-containing protein, partial [Rhodoluna sp.]